MRRAAARRAASRRLGRLPGCSSGCPAAHRRSHGDAEPGDDGDAIVTAGILTRTRAHVRQPLYRSAYSLMINTGLNAVLGLGFWIAAARLYPADEVGRDSVLIATMMAVSSICQLNMANAIPRFLPQVADPARTLRNAYLVSGAVALVLASAFVVIVAQIPGDLEVLADEPLLAAGFVAGTIVWGMFSLQDAAFVAMRQAPWVPVKNSIFGGLKLAALPALLAFGGAHAIIVNWVGSMALMLLPVSALLFFRVLPAHRRTHTDRARRGHRAGPAPAVPGAGLRVAGARTDLDHAPAAACALDPGEQRGGLLLHRLHGPDVARLLVSNMGTSLTVESAFDERRLQSLARVVVRRTLVVALPLIGLLVLVAPIILKPFGPEYAEQGTPLLRLLLLALVFRTVIVLFVAISRCRRRGRTLLALDVALFVLVIGLTLVLTPSMGLEGAGSRSSSRTGSPRSPSSRAWSGSSCGARSRPWDGGGATGGPRPTGRTRRGGRPQRARVRRRPADARAAPRPATRAAGAAGPRRPAHPRRRGGGLPRQRRPDGRRRAGRPQHPRARPDVRARAGRRLPAVPPRPRDLAGPRPRHQPRREHASGDGDDVALLAAGGGLVRDGGSLFSLPSRLRS